MSTSVHNPDQYMASLRQIIAQGRKRLGLLVGAGAPASIKAPGSSEPLIPAVVRLTEIVLTALAGKYRTTLVSSASHRIGPHKIVTTISPQTMRTLQNYHWPGNVRELANVVDRALINTNGTVLQLADKLDVDTLPAVDVDGNGKALGKIRGC